MTAAGRWSPATSFPRARNTSRSSSVTGTARPSGWRISAPWRFGAGHLQLRQHQRQKLRGAGGLRPVRREIIEVVDKIKAMIPRLRAMVPPSMDLQITMERTWTIRASIHDVQRSLVIATALVVLVVFAFLRRFRATLIPGVAVPVSILGTFGVMYLCGYSLNNLWLMALTIRRASWSTTRWWCWKTSRDMWRTGCRLKRRRAGAPGGDVHGDLDERLAHRGVHPDPPQRPMGLLFASSPSCFRWPSRFHALLVSRRRRRRRARGCGPAP